MAKSARPIRELPEHLINQIAAGEVIERPASIVKELIENSLDAGASRIEVQLGDGGLEFVSVADDGSGIEADELAAALRRHWTSKLAQPADLAAIATLGFRGEALASIAAVARVELLSRTAAAAHGWRLDSVPGRAPGAAQPAPATRGTRVTVRELFHEIPARRRFLKRGRTEFLHVQQVVRRAAFARPDVGFRLSQAGSRALELGAVAGDGGAARWRTLFGQRFAQDARRVEVAVDGVRVVGWVGPAELATHQAELQFLALNGRPIRDRQLAHAVRMAYGDDLPEGRLPQYALALSLAHDQVDVNVHPGKLEVRFAELRTVHDVLFAAVREALGERDDTRSDPEPAPSGARALAERSSPYVTMPVAAATAPEALPAWCMHALALVDGDLLLYQDGARTFVLDLRAAWRTVLRARLARGGARRALLIPERLSASEAQALAPCLARLEALGFEIDSWGPAGAVVRGVPTVLPQLPAGLVSAALAGGGLASDPLAAIAAAAAALVDTGAHGRPRQGMLETLARAAAHAGIALDEAARELSGARLWTVLGDAR